MKKLLLFVTATMTLHVALLAQNTRFGFTAGTSIANYKYEYAGIKISGDAKVGISAGILVDIPVGGQFSIQPALNFLQKGSTYEDLGEKAITNVNCLEIPVNILYNASSGSGSFFVGAGPSFAFNMSGKEKYDDGTGEIEEDLSFGSDQDNDDMKSLDAGANFLAGYRLANGLFFSAGYNVGLSNLSLFPDDDESIKSNYFSFKIGFMLGGKK
ncbi:MAG TPA: porin family protein [Chitinophagaceae bacterium]